MGLESNTRELTEMVETLPKSKRDAVIKHPAVAEAFSAGKRFTQKANEDAAKMKKDRDAKKSRSEGADNDEAKAKKYESVNTNEDILALINKIKDKQHKQNEKIYFDAVSPDVANKIFELTGVDVTGFKVAIEARQLEHILVDHGQNGKTDKSMSNEEDVAKIEYVIKKPDSIALAGRTQAYSYMKNGYNRTAQTVLYEKEIGNKSYYVVQAVPDTQAKTLYIVSAFIGEKGYKKMEPHSSSMKNFPDATSNNGSVVTPNNSISPKSEKVNISDENFSANNGKTQKKQSGDKFSIDKSIDTSKLSSKQKKFIRLAKLFSKCFTDLNVRIVNSKPDANGEYHKENGSYNVRTNTIEININAGKVKEGGFFDYLLNETLSHETVHYIKAHSLSDYNALKAFLKKHVYTSVQWNNLVLKRLNEYYNGDPDCYNDAEEEVVANGCQTMFNSPRVLYSLAKNNLRLFEKIKFRVNTFFDNLIRKLGDHVNYTVEARAVMQSTEKTQRELEKKFIEALRNANARSATTESVEATEQESKAVKASKREGANTTPIATDMTEEERNNGIRVAEFIENVNQMLDESKRSKRKKKIGVLSKKHATVINALMRTINPSFSAEGYELWIDGTGAQHIEIRHGKNGKADSTMASKQAKSLIPWAAQNADGSEFIRDEEGNIKRSDRFYNFDGTRAPEIRLEKSTLGGIVYVSECVPDSANKRIWITSAYVNKKGSKGQLLNIEDKSSPQPTPEASFDSNATTVIIPETSEKSNSFSKNSLEKSSNLEKDEIDGNREIGYNENKHIELNKGDLKNGKERAEQDKGTETVYSRGEKGNTPVSNGTRTEVRNRSGIQETVGRKDGSVQETLSAQRQHRRLRTEIEPFLDEDYVTPEQSSELYKVQHEITEEYGIECHIVKRTAWNRENPATTYYGKIYLSEDIELGDLSEVASHETTHGMKHKNFKRYLEFIERTADMLKINSQECNDLMCAISEHLGIDILVMNETQLVRFYDELNATIYGLYKGGVMDDPNFNTKWIVNAFYDFDAYIRELDSIHEQFKVTMSETFSEESIETFEQGDRDVMYSKLERDEITVRDMLATNLEELAVTKAEKKRIAEYRGKLDEQSECLEKIDKLRDELNNIKNRKGDRDIELRKKDIRAEIKALQYKIAELDSELLKLQNLRSLRNVVKRTAERLVEKSHFSDEMYYYRKLAEKDRQHQGQIRSLKAKHVENMAKEVAKREQEQQQNKDELRRIREEHREKVEYKVIKEKIQKLYKKMTGMIKRPDDKHYVPHQLLGPLANVLELLDFDTDYFEKTGKGEKIKIKRKELRDALRELARRYENEVGKNEDFDILSEYEEEYKAYFERLADILDDRKVSELDIETLAEVAEILQEIDQALSDAKKLIDYEYGTEIREVVDTLVKEQLEVIHTNKRKPDAELNRLTRLVRVMGNKALTPMQIVEELSGYLEDAQLKRLFEAFAKGTQEQIEIILKRLLFFATGIDFFLAVWYTVCVI